MAEPAIVFKDVNKWFGKLHVLEDINLSIDAGEVVVVCGPSGSGKSTLIRCVNGLERVQRVVWEIHLRDQPRQEVLAEE